MTQPSNLAARIGMAGLVIAAGLLAYRASTQVFHQAPVTTDENSYVFQAVNFAEGRIAREAPPFPRAFAHRMIIIDDEAGWLSRYPPLHALWLVPGIWLGNPYLMSALAAMLTMLLLASLARQQLGASWAWTLPALLVVSPYFVFMHGTLLSHTSGLTAAAVLAWGYMRWRDTGRWQHAVIAGLGWAAICLNRTYTGLCLCVPLGLDALWVLWKQRTGRRLLGVVGFAAASATGVIALLIYNALAVGDPMTMTYLFYDPSEALGFGPRHTSGLSVDHSLMNGLGYLRDNVISLDRWLLGLPFGLGVMALLVVAGWQWRTSFLLVVCTLSVWLGYVYFWFPGIDETGPVYFMETMPFMALAAAQGVKRVGQWTIAGPAWTRWAVGLTALVLVANAAWFGLNEGHRLSSETYAERAALRHTLEAAPPGSLVFVPDHPHKDFLVLNTHGLDSDPLALSPVPGKNMAIVKYFADRKIFRLEFHPSPRLVPHQERNYLNFSAAGSKFHRHTGANQERDGVAVRVATAGEHAAGVLAFGVTVQAYPGRFACHFDIEASGGGTNVTAVVKLIKGPGRTVIAAHEVHGGITNGVTFELELDDFPVLEPQVHYTGDGDLVLRRITIRDLAPGTD